MPVSKSRKLKITPKVNIKEKVKTTVTGKMSEPSEWVLSLREKKTSPNTIKLQETKRVSSKAFVLWDSSQGAYRNGENRKENKRIRLAEKKADARKKRLDK